MKTEGFSLVLLEQDVERISFEHSFKFNKAAFLCECFPFHLFFPDVRGHCQLLENSSRFGCYSVFCSKFSLGSLCCLMYQPGSAQMFHKAEPLSCKSQLPFKCAAARASDRVAHTTSSYLSALVPSEGSCNGAGNKFRASTGRQEESGAGSPATVAPCRVGVAVGWKTSVIPSDKHVRGGRWGEILTVFSKVGVAGMAPAQISSGGLASLTGE